YLHGAHVTHFQPRQPEGGPAQRPVLFLSTRSNFEPGKPIRGGVPVIFPWFGPWQGAREGDKSMMHGFVRTRQWKVESVEAVAPLSGGAQHRGSAPPDANDGAAVRAAFV